MKNGLIIFMFLFALACTKYFKNRGSQITLNSKWEFRQADKEKWYPATVPGVVHTDLFDNHLIGDPYWENNEIEQAWIEEENWVYKNEFKVSESQLQFDQIEIDFEGLDTYAAVYLNDSLILRANNMFRSWHIPIKKYLKIGDNVLKVRFTSPLNKHVATLENAAYELPSGNETVSKKVSAYTRKAAYHFGWDWGPRFVTSGIWKKVSIHSWNEAKIKHVWSQTVSISDTMAILNIQVAIEKALEKNKTVELKVQDKVLLLELKEKITTIEVELEIENPKLWWCNGLGESNMYDIDVRLYNKTACIDSLYTQVGIRTIELVNQKDSIGTSFYFKLNGKPVFMKGANYIPQDVFLNRVDSSGTARLIEQVKRLNMNMLRVWGGGVYESDVFYELCDKNGILIWQDFMFAGSMYPNDTSFKNNIAAEVKDNVIRLRNHPCLALWCGNNEIAVAWENWGWQKQYNYSVSDSTAIWENYLGIFHELIPSLISKYSQGIAYTPTSPLSNWGKAANFNHSSMHYWGVWHGKDDFEDYPENVGRFMVEYGFQSYPNWASIEKFTEDSSLYLNSLVMKNRQKSYVGNQLIIEQINKRLGAAVNFKDFIAKSQTVQKIGLEMAIKAHMNSPKCMGTLFWQLNDCWPGPSWSIIDYYGEEKEAFEMVKHEFSKTVN